MVLFEVALVLAGFAILIKSADEAIGRLVNISRRLRVSEFIISFIIVGAVSAMPELSIGVNSAIEGIPAFGLGIIFGSNVADLTLVIGVFILTARSATIRTPALRIDKWFLAAMVLPVILLLDGDISRFDGALLVLAYAAYVWTMLRIKPRVGRRLPAEPGSLAADAGMALLMLGILLFGGWMINHGAHQIGLELSLPQLFLGQILAIGTCLPELTFAVRSAKMRHGELGFGDIFGNVFADCLLTLGIIALVSPIAPPKPYLALAGGGMMVMAMLVLLAVFDGRRKVGKNEGLIMVAAYGAFVLLEIVAERVIVNGGI